MLSITKQLVSETLLSENYSKAKKKLGEKAIRHLKAIVKGKDWGLAAKATYLAGLLDTDKSAAVVDAAARSRKPALRVAAASAAAQLSPERAEPILERLLKSKDVGIRKQALRAVKEVTPAVEKQLKKIETKDELEPLKTMAAELLNKKK